MARTFSAQEFPRQVIIQGICLSLCLAGVEEEGNLESCIREGTSLSQGPGTARLPRLPDHLGGDQSDPG